MKIEIVVSCAWYQKRLNWMISSVINQKGDNVPELAFSVAYPPNNGTPTTEEVCKYFKKFNSDKFTLKELCLPMDLIKSRGLVRNMQLEKTDADWIVFADTDMVYDTFFFDDLAKRLSGDLKDEEKCICASRISLDKEYSKNFFNNGEGSKLSYPVLIENPSDKVSTWPVYRITSNIGAGYFQVANVQMLRTKHKGLYVDPSKGKRDFWTGTKSDRRFRQMLGGICPITTKPQYHLNHERDNEMGEHVEIQR